MKTLGSFVRLCLQALAVAALVSCGGGGGGEPDHPPSISVLRYSPATALQVSKGTVTINGAVDFTDAGGDIASLRMVSSGGVDLTVPTPALSGIKSGTGVGAFVVSVDQVGKYTFEVWVTDSQGNSSNRLSGTFEVLPAAGQHSPSVSNLRYSPTTALQVPGGTVTIDGAIGFVDAGADIAAIRVASSAGFDLTLPMSGLSGVASGTATMSFVVSVDVVGNYTLEVWAVDGLGAASNRLSGTFEVLPQDTTGSWIRLAVVPPYKLFGVDFNGQKYVAVGMHGTVMTSSDVDHWALQTSGVNHTLHSVASSPARFVAVGDNSIGEAVIISSTDGASWSVQYRSGACQGSVCASPSMLSKVIWAGAQFIAVGQERDAATSKPYALILTSPDGVAWTQRAAQMIPLDDEFIRDLRQFTSVAWSGSLLVAVGIDSQANPTAWRSTDAVTWTPAPLPPGAVWASPLQDIAWGNGRFVAVGPSALGGDAPVLTSLDGINWQIDTTSTNLPEMNAVTTGASEYLAVGGTHRQTSPDGRLWTVFPLTGCGSDVLWDGSRYVSVGETICRSP